ncbi:MAG: pectate lyase [Brevundimonas sp.]|uniref:pectate lyase family protein n=1 Tax=Brevundimonas sp. TaxID=1871086 RepID=UPI002736A003|nr:pectate lyase [Brevundimonas sp.]MDP3406211.1 pectate lyase [Brevundimonas sp.]
MIDRRQMVVSTAGLAALGCAGWSRPQAEAFPGAMGWARTTPGGRNGVVLRVTHLGSSGEGSLRAALETPVPRIIVFEVGGVIDLEGRSITVSHPFVTVAGQTAPEPGITLIRGGLSLRSHDIVIRHIRVRPGANGAAPRSGWEVDGLATSAAHDVIVDQCSFSWATDENLSASGPRFDGGDTVEAWRQYTSRRITFSRNIVAEGLSNSSHAKGEHSKGSLIHDNATDILIVGNLYAHNHERNQLFKGGAHAVSANNWIYDPGNRCMHYGLNAPEWEGRPWEVGQLTIVGNVTTGGASTRRDLPFFLAESQGDVAVFLHDNPAFHADGRPMQETAVQSDRDLRIIRLAEPPQWPPGFEARPSGEVVARVEAEAGARPWARDSVDQRILAQARDGTGRIIDDEREVGGYPQAPQTRRPFVEAEWDMTTMTRRDGRPT